MPNIFSTIETVLVSGRRSLLNVSVNASSKRNVAVPNHVVPRFRATRASPSFTDSSDSETDAASQTRSYSPLPSVSCAIKTTVEPVGGKHEQALSDDESDDETDLVAQMMNLTSEYNPTFAVPPPFEDLVKAAEVELKREEEERIKKLNEAAMVAANAAYEHLLALEGQKGYKEYVGRVTRPVFAAVETRAEFPENKVDANCASTGEPLGQDCRPELSQKETSPIFTRTPVHAPLKTESAPLARVGDVAVTHEMTSVVTSDRASSMPPVIANQTRLEKLAGRLIKPLPSPKSRLIVAKELTWATERIAGLTVDPSKATSMETLTCLLMATEVYGEMDVDSPYCALRYNNEGYALGKRARSPSSSSSDFDANDSDMTTDDVGESESSEEEDHRTPKRLKKCGGGYIRGTVSGRMAVY